MNFSQKFGLFVLILISALYIYFSFFAKDFKLPEFKKQPSVPQEYNPLDNTKTEEQPEVQQRRTKAVKIYVLDKSGNVRPVGRLCDDSIKTSCFEFAINELLSAPSNWEKSKGFVSEIPQGTKLLSVRESSSGIMIDLSSNFETGGGAESTYLRIIQVIKTANANTSAPVYLYINGKQANVIGGEGVMLKQPLNDKSLDG
jgi:spore germination protein GerM